MIVKSPVNGASGNPQGIRQIKEPYLLVHELAPETMERHESRLKEKENGSVNVYGVI
jgi:hypothetical protein